MTLVLFVGGGSVGHIAPSIAVWEALKQQRSDIEALFLCADRADERDFLQTHGLPHKIFNAPRLSFALPWKFVQALVAAKKLLRERKPAVIFSKGGYVSLPVCVAAWLQRIPIVLHESDAVRGWANTFIALIASHVCIGLAEEKPGGRSTLTGNPVRATMNQGARDTGLRLTNFPGDRAILIVMGGSQGSQALNEAVMKNLEALTGACDIIHLTGREKGSDVRRSGYWQTAFAVDDLPHLYACADMALSRAGAGSIGELAANGIATVFCPLRDVAHDHQQSNADLVLAAGGCIVIQQVDLTNRLIDTISALAQSPEQRQILGQNLRKFHHPDAARQIAGIIGERLASEKVST